MGLSGGRDATGEWAALGCYGAGCDAHESVRPDGPQGDLLALVEAVEAFAIEDGWFHDETDDSWWCPSHAGEAAARIFGRTTRRSLGPRG